MHKQPSGRVLWKMCPVKILEVYIKHLHYFFYRCFHANYMNFFKTSILWKLLNFLLTSAGVGRTGVFIALSNSIEQMNIEGAVNIFQIVKKMREQRLTKIMTRVRKFQSSFCMIAVWLKKELAEAPFQKCSE